MRLLLGVETGRTVVPEASIQDGLSGKYLWLIRSGTASIDPVTVLRTYRPPEALEEATIGVGGIRPGDMVVTEGQHCLTAGATVALLYTPRTEA